MANSFLVYIRCLLYQYEFSLTREGDEQPEDVVGALEYPEDPQVPHNLLQTGVLHVAHPAQDLDALVRHEPRSLGGKHLGDGRLQLVVLVAPVASCSLRLHSYRASRRVAY